jgi:hypothetical protein
MLAITITISNDAFGGAVIGFAFTAAVCLGMQAVSWAIAAVFDWWSGPPRFFEGFFKPFVIYTVLGTVLGGLLGSYGWSLWHITQLIGVIFFVLFILTHTVEHRRNRV